MFNPLSTRTLRKQLAKLLLASQSQSVPQQGVSPSHEEDIAFVLVEFHEVPVGIIRQCFWKPLFYLYISVTCLKILSIFSISAYRKETS